MECLTIIIGLLLGKGARKADNSSYEANCAAPTALPLAEMPTSIPSRTWVDTEDLFHIFPK